MQILPHVTGLRAYAVIAVLLFHLGFPRFAGGFIGVDVFFVISGFLITGLLVREIEATGGVDLGDFFTRRIRRLFPALIVTLAITFAASAYFLSPDHLQRAALSTVLAALSVSNILFWWEAGYFDVLEATKPLLHTWSLGVEMQFYLIWPLFVLIISKLAPRQLLSSILIAALASLATNYLVTGDALFFLTPFRVFEFAIGSALVWTYRLRAPATVANLGSVLGLALVLLPVFAFDGTEVYPRHFALVPCLGTALLIQFGSSRAGNFLLSNRLAVGIGEISYSLYLVHWPLIVLYGYWNLGLADGDRVVLAFLSFVLAMCLYFFVERPFRRRGTFSHKNIWLASAAATVLVTAPALSAVEDGWSYRQASYYPVEIQERERAIDESTKTFCRIEATLVGDCDLSRHRKILMIGDSHLRAMSYAFREALPDTQIINLSYLGCHDALSVVGGRAVSDQQEEFCAQKAGFINSNPALFRDIDAVVLASYRPYSYHANQFRFDLLDLILSKTGGVPAIVVGDYFQTPQSKYCSAIVQRRRSVEACMGDDFVEYVGTLDQVRTESLYATHGLKYEFLDIAKLFCPSLRNCPAQYDGAPFLFDADHLTPSFAKHMMQTIVEKHPDVLARLGILPR